MGLCNRYCCVGRAGRRLGGAGGGCEERVRADPGRISGGCRGCGVTDRRGSRTRVRRCRSSHRDRQEPSEWEGAYQFTR